ncbi:inovirus-type Gp2 protein [Devosia sp.]|uniref:YagK/YfjJ domain-containing protein n=1 Tax=Devosia sp. TaxID=1871048 RepID=UPI0027359BC3|nr:inovirus-type Gp2 protein [Devosia sp.]MDP2780064.1 inovirus-type Gp2 protein [Devosia sp.]
MKNNREYNHEFTSSEFYDELTNSLNSYYAKVNGKVATFRCDSEIYSLSLIEQFVKKIINSKKIGFIKNVEILKDRILKVTYSQTELGIYFKSINAFISVIRRYEEFYILSEYVNLFQDSSNKLILPTVIFRNPNDFIYKIEKYEADLYNELIESIRANSKAKEFKKIVSNRKTNSVRQQKSALKYIDTLFTQHLRLLVLRIDLGYLVNINTSSDTPGQNVTLEQANKDFKRFKNNWRHNRLFENLVGNIWKLEFSECKGYHYHLILFFRELDVCNDACISDLIGKYWKQNITDNHGTFHNCNAQKKKYFHLGDGLIDATADVELRANLNNVAIYLTMNEQFLKAKLGKNDKSYGSGVVPKKEPMTMTLPKPINQRTAEDQYSNATKAE